MRATERASRRRRARPRGRPPREIRARGTPPGPAERLRRAVVEDHLPAPALDGPLDRAPPAARPGRKPSWPRSRRAANFGAEAAGPLHPAQFTRNPSEKLGVAARAADRGRDRAEDAQPELAAGRLDLADDAPPRLLRASRRRPRGTSPRPASNCGFTRTTTDAARLRRRATIAGRIRRREMNDTSDDGQIDRLRHVGRREGAGVHLLPHDDARVGAQPRVELAVADVDGVDARGAALEEAVREARPSRRPRRGRSGPPGRGRSGRGPRRASRLRARRRDAAGPRPRPRRPPTTPSPAFSARRPSTDTRPARIIACAFSRVGREAPRHEQEVEPRGFKT